MILMCVQIIVLSSHHRICRHSLSTAEELLKIEIYVLKDDFVTKCNNSEITE